MERTLTADASQRLADLRDQAAEQRRKAITELSEAGPAATLDAIAWTTGVEGPMPEDPRRIVALIDQARAERLTWREISGACGEGDSELDARRMRGRYRLWSKSSTLPTLQPQAAKRT